jgi:ABC-type multidrug transport system ATPase subunit
MIDRVYGIECENLRKAYRDVQALDDVSFRANAGKVLALLGSNGSGKTTTVRVLTTQVAHDSGAARVCGKDVLRDAPAVRETIGLTAQETHIDKYITAAEYMNLVAWLRHIPRRARKQETMALLTEFELDQTAHALTSSYSGGMRRRLDLAASLIGNPAVLFLDEPSNGLDPHSRKRLWDVIRRRADEGATVLLTTQYMEEADALADSIVVLAHGQVIASGTPGELKDQIRGRVVELTVGEPQELVRATALLADVGVRPGPGETPDALSFVLPQSSPSLVELLRQFDAEGITISDAIARRPTLDEAFLQLTSEVERVPEPSIPDVAL